MTWVLWIWTIAMAAWAVGAGFSGDSKLDAKCVNDLGAKLCNDTQNAGAGIAVILLIFAWFFGFVVLGLIWFMTRPKQVVIGQQGEAPRA